jgi:hypothetical protein
LDTDNGFAIHACQWKQLASWEKANHFISQFQDSDELTRFFAEQVFVLKSVTAVFDHYF